MLPRRACSLNRQGYLHRVSGYTLLELLAVIALLSLLAALAVPRFTNHSYWQLEVASRRLAADLRLLRQSAINSGESCRVDFYIHYNRYTLRLPDGSQRIYFPEGVQFEGNTTFEGRPPALRFNNLGRPSSGGTVALKAGDAYRFVITTPVTGRVRVSRSPPLHW